MINTRRRLPHMTRRRLSVLVATAILPVVLAVSACTAGGSAGQNADSKGGGSQGQGGTTANQNPGQTGQADQAVANPAVNYAGTYLIHSIFRGDKECLDANYQQADAGHGGAFMKSCDKSVAQRWKLKLISPGLYQLQAGATPSGVCLNGNTNTSIVHDGASFAEPCRSIASQSWTFTVADGGYLRLHSELYDQSVCLESNEAGSAEHSGAVFMDLCQPASGQFWSLQDA